MQQSPATTRVQVAGSGTAVKVSEEPVRLKVPSWPVVEKVAGGEPELEPNVMSV